MNSATAKKSSQQTLQVLCFYMGLEVPQEFRAVAQDEFSGIRAGTTTVIQGCIFFLRDEKYDDILATAEIALQKGARILVYSEPISNQNGISLPVIVHPYPTQAFVDICAHIKQQTQVKTIAITGSIGKTTIKEMTEAVVQQSFNTLSSRSNQNGIQQVGRYIQKLNSDHELYIQETGAAHCGSIQFSASMLQPDAFVVSNIGLNHIGDYGGKQENIIKDKLSFDDYMPQEGIAFLNFDDEILRSVSLKHQIVYYSVKDPSADYFASEISAVDDCITFAVHEKVTGRKTEARIRAFGLHNVQTR